MEDGRRYRFIEDNPAVAEQGWFPPAGEVPELAHLRADHDRLLDTITHAVAEAGGLRRKREAELEAQRAAHEAAFLGRALGEVPSLTVSEDEIDQAAARAQAAWDALVTFAQEAIAEVRGREPALLEQLDAVVAEANAKRAEAARIAADADAMEAGTRKLRAWLGRATGRSPLGQFAYEQMATPDPDGGANGRLTVADLHAAQNPGFGFTDDIEDASGAFGTDDPDNLDADSRPWEQPLPEEALHGN